MLAQNLHQHYSSKLQFACRAGTYAECHICSLLLAFLRQSGEVTVRHTSRRRGCASCVCCLLCNKRAVGLQRRLPVPGSVREACCIQHRSLPLTPALFLGHNASELKQHSWRCVQAAPRMQ